MRQILREISIHQSSLFRIIHDDLGLKCLKKHRSQELTQANRAVRMQHAKKLYLEHEVDCVWFTSEKTIHFCFQQWKNFQNRLTFDEVIAKSLTPHVLKHSVVHLLFLHVFKQDKMADDSVRHSTFMFGGIEYTLSMSVQDGSQLTVQVEEQSSTDQWRNTFDVNCKFFFGRWLYRRLNSSTYLISYDCTYLAVSASSTLSSNGQ